MYLDHGLLEAVERAFDQDLLLLVEGQQVVPQRLLRQHLRVADDDDTKSDKTFLLSGHWLWG